jgi:hypothetical protein
MGGTSTTQQTQNSTTNPWAPATACADRHPRPGAAKPRQYRRDRRGKQCAQHHAGQRQQLHHQLRPADRQLCERSSGGRRRELNQAGNVNQNYQRYVDQTNPLASNTNYDPYSTPGLKDYLSTLTSDITSGVNGQFAAAGGISPGPTLRRSGAG